MSDTTYKILRSGDVRVRIEYDQFAEHPWLANDMQCNLACWNAEYGDWLPWKSRKNDKGGYTLTLPEDQYTLLRSKEAVQDWLTEQERQYAKLGKTFMIRGISYFDRYGDVVLHSQYDEESDRYDGAIFLSQDDFEVRNGGDIAVDNFRKAIEGDFEELRAWLTGCVFG